MVSPAKQLSGQNSLGTDLLITLLWAIFDTLTTTRNIQVMVNSLLQAEGGEGVVCHDHQCPLIQLNITYLIGIMGHIRYINNNTEYTSV